jgi:hypothetical protein
MPRTTFFDIRHRDGFVVFIKIGFSPIKSPNSSRKSIRFFLEITELAS